MGRRMRSTFILVVYGVSCVVTGERVRYQQNCAARGVCDTLFDVRNKSSHDAPQGSPRGHLKPVGHPEFVDSWQGEMDSHSELEPAKFWKEYHASRKPFVLKGAMLDSPSINWTDAYIMQHFGDEVAKVEWRNEDRLTDYCGMKIGGQVIRCPKDIIPYVESRTSIRNFIRTSTANPEWPKYIISQMPDEMAKEWNIPGTFNCGKRPNGGHVEGKPWMTQLYENNFWYLRVPPNKMGTSTIHYDMNHQIMCMIAGKKEWIVWNLEAEGARIPMWNNYYVPPSKGRSSQSDDSPIDGEKVDLLRWPNFAKAKWSNTTLEKGDCLYTPANLLHYVRSWTDDPDDERIVALMTMFQAEERYDPSHCHDVPRSAPLSEYDVMWGEFPGSMEVPMCMNHIKMGYPNWKRMVQSLAEKELGSPSSFVEFWQSVEPRYPKKQVKQAWGRFNAELNAGNWTERVFKSKAVAQLAKDISCAAEGNRGPERKLKDGESWDARNEYSLAGADAKDFARGRHDEF